MKPSTDSKTWANLRAAYAAECGVRTKYDYFASLAKKEGYEQISAIFKDTASNEKEHAELWLKQLGEGESTTLENLKTAAQGEHGEWTEMYRDYAPPAREEGYPEIAALLEGVAEIEREHEMRFNALVHNFTAQPQRIFSKESDVVWVCRNCGHVHVGSEAPKICPVCAHPQGYFELKANNY